MATPETTPRIEANELTDGQAFAYLTVNEAFQLLDFFAQPRLLGMAETTPPVSASMGDAYIVGVGTGLWTGEDGNIAIWLGGWRFKTVVTGMYIWDDVAAEPKVWNGTAWETITSV